MIDVAAIKGSADLKLLVSDNVTLRKTANTRGGEYHGPCPFCNGTDRFWVHPYYNGGEWKCRACGKGGDAIKYLMERDSIGFLDACGELERRFGLQPITTRPHLVQIVADEPSASWRQKAMVITAECMCSLWSDGLLASNGLAYLHSRGLKNDTITTFLLGFSAPERKQTEQTDDGQIVERWGQWKHGMWVPHGVTIPALGADGQLWAVNVRQPKGEKYRGVVGSKLSALRGRLSGKPVLILTEGDFDMMLTWQEAGDLVDVATFGSAAAGLGDRWLPYVLRYQRVLLAYDNDEAGNEGAARIMKSLARAERVRMPLAASEGKDISDLHRAGGNLRSWVSMLLAVGGARWQAEEVTA
jgi:DNA primase